MSKKNTTHDNATQPPESIETLGQLFDAYIASLVDRGKSAGTARSYAADLAVAKKHFGADLVLTALTPETVAGFFASDAVRMTRKGVPKSKITTAKIKRVLRLALLWAEGESFFEKA
ncbi:MAG TPA: hypothetical protein ENK43_12375, partial [Planctomycetes bacterium]|nr:hypothetical protein [Planctomycetota bacterium]